VRRPHFGRINTRAQGADSDINFVRVKLLHNPKAGRAEYSKKKLIAALRQAGHQVSYKSTKERGWTKNLASREDLILVAGGDGTVGKVAHKLIGRRTPLAILPTGTANNLAHTLGFTEPTQELINRLHFGEPTGFDVGVAVGPWGERHFFEATGAGLLADYLRQPKPKIQELSREEEMRWHVFHLRKLLGNYPARQWKLTVDGKKITGPFLMLEAMNVRSVGPALHLAPKARTEDGLFELIIVREEDRDALMDYLGRRFQSRHKVPLGLPILRFRKLRIRCRRTHFHIDSESWPAKKKELDRPVKVEIRIKPSALMISRLTRD
jgi:diacylglycerol kinase family enzyme